MSVCIYSIVQEYLPSLFRISDHLQKHITVLIRSIHLNNKNLKKKHKLHKQAKKNY